VSFLDDGLVVYLFGGSVGNNDVFILLRFFIRFTSKDIFIRLNWLNVLLCFTLTINIIVFLWLVLVCLQSIAIQIVDVLLCLGDDLVL
jgi:uncharacterized membrane-anchored protein